MFYLVYIAKILWNFNQYFSEVSLSSLEEQPSIVEDKKSSTENQSNLQIDDIKRELERQLENQKRFYEQKIDYQTERFERQLASQTKEIKKLQQQIHELFEREKEQVAPLQREIQTIKIDENHEKIEDIGFNTNGKVMKVIKKDIYALKTINISNPNNVQLFKNESAILSKYNHPNILKIFNIESNSNDRNSLSILYEYCPLNLDKAIKTKKLNKVQISCLFYQIVEGMKYIHSLRIIHRNLKPTNILIDKDGIAKIGDIGVSILFTTIDETQKFMAPEIINNEEFDEKIDVYSFGVLAYFILNNGDIQNIKIRDICLGKAIQIPSSFNVLAQQLIAACLSIESKNRPSFSIISEILEKQNFELLDLSENERNEVSMFMKQFSGRLPVIFRNQ